MSRFKRLKYYLGFTEAIKIYWNLKIKNLSALRVKALEYPFAIRDNPSDYATFIEVLVKKDYLLPFKFEPNTIIDAGGNIGLTAVFFANQFPNAQIITVEPDKRNFELLQKNVSFYKNISALNKGIWTNASFVNVIDTGLGENGFIVEETTTPGEGAVEATGIHEIMREKGWTGIDLLKIDIEGTEKNIFETNYEEWIPFTKVLFVEGHDRMKKGCTAAIFRAMNRYNFSCTVAGENFLFVNEELLNF